MQHKTPYLESEVLYKVLEILYRAIDELEHELAPEGWMYSPYHFPFELIEGKREALYRTYDTVACVYERKFGCMLRQYISKSRYEIDYMTHSGANYSSTVELVYLIEHVVAQLNYNGLFFKSMEPRHHFLIEPMDILEQSYSLGVDLDLANTMDAYMLSMTTARNDVLLYIDLSVLYAKALGAFQSLGYDWRYRDDDLVALWEDSQLYALMKQTRNQSKTMGKLLQSLAEIENELPPDEVLGYLSAFDKLPIGYPPTLADIRYISELRLDLSG